jgi:hypothetical protein
VSEYFDITFSHLFFSLSRSLFLFPYFSQILLLQYLEKTHEYSRHYTIIFNTYVLMQLVNELNCRKLEGERNVFEGITNNKYFVRIWIVTVILQVVFAQFGGPIVGCSSRGLSVGQWGFCLVVSLGTLLWQQVINAVADYTLDIVQTPGKGGGVLKFGRGKITTGLQTSVDANKLSDIRRDGSIRKSRR